MSDQPPATPPVEPLMPEGAPPAERLRRLERRSRALLFGLIVCCVLVVTLTALNVALLSRYGVILAEQRAREQAQFQLLEQLRDDFEALELDVPRNRLEAYGQLRERLNELKDFYGNIADYDVTDPEGSLDRLIGQEPGERRRTSDPTPVAPPREPPPTEDEDHSSGG